jgi:hypothetical protein
MGQSSRDGDEPTIMFETGHKCTDGDCCAELLVTECINLLQVMLPTVDSAGVTTIEPFLGPNHEYAYEPFFFHDGCWANIMNALSDLLEEYELSDLLEQDPYSFAHCAGCRRGLRVGELLGTVQLGEFSGAIRAPEGHAAKYTAYNQAPEYLCLSCLRAVNEDIIELWERISYAGECTSCTFERNWRIGVPCTHEE